MDIKAEKKSVGMLLGQQDQQFRIPSYQRPYAWTLDEVADLWEDLIGSLGQGHFLGSVVLNAEDEWKPELIDGQQRVTTLALLLGELRDALYASGDLATAMAVQQRLLANGLSTGA